MPMSPKAFDWEDSGTEKPSKEEPTRSHHGVTAFEWKLSLLRLSQIHLMFGRQFWLENNPNKAMSHFQSTRYYVDQFCRMKRQFAGSNGSVDNWTNNLSLGSMITLSDFLKVYECLEQYDQYLQLVTTCIGYLESNNSIKYPDEYFEDAYGDKPEVKVLDLSDLLCLRAKILIKQYGLKMTDAFYDLKKAISIDRNHSEANRLMMELNNLSEKHLETACLMILKSRTEEAVPHIRTAVLAQPEKAILRFDLASVLRRLGKLNEALESFLHGVHLLHSNNDKEDREWFRRNALYELFYILLDMSWDKLQNGLPRIASIFLENLKQIAPRNIMIHLLQGDCEYAMGNFPNALEHYQKSKALLDEFKNSQSQCMCNFLELYNSNLNIRISQTLYSISLTKIGSKQFQEALDNLTSCIQLFPLIPQYYVIRMKLYYQCRQLEESWKDLLACIYLYLSDASLTKRTNGRWTKLREIERYTVRQQLAKQVRELIGPILNRLTPKATNLIHLANSQQCLDIVQQMMDVTQHFRCRYCMTFGKDDTQSFKHLNIKSRPIKSNPGRSLSRKPLSMKVFDNTDSLLRSNFELKVIKSDISKLRKLGKVM